MKQHMSSAVLLASEFFSELQREACDSLGAMRHLCIVICAGWVQLSHVDYVGHWGQAVYKVPL